jgi:hypothetical protein
MTKWFALSVLLLSLAACAVDDPAGLASNESAVESAPAPSPEPETTPPISEESVLGDEVPAPGETEEDMRIRQLYLACYNSCGNGFFSCMFLECHMAAGSNCAATANPESACQCEGSCSGEQSQCWEGCSNLFNHAN